MERAGARGSGKGKYGEIVISLSEPQERSDDLDGLQQPHRLNRLKEGLVEFRDGRHNG